MQNQGAAAMATCGREEIAFAGEEWPVEIEAESSDATTMRPSRAQHSGIFVLHVMESQLLFVRSMKTR